MSKKKIALQYVEASLSLRDKETKLSDALLGLYSDNYLISVIPEDYQHLVNTLVLEVLGGEIVDWLDWWLYEADRVNNQVTTIDGVDLTINSFDELWEKVIEPN